VVTCVDDDGPGIPDDFLPRAFTPFARPDPASGVTPSSAGDPFADESIGLGLGLAHGLADAMHGELSVGRSGPGGTSMVLRLPRAETSQP
jgi:signal transduction histidine kinase